MISFREAGSRLALSDPVTRFVCLGLLVALAGCAQHLPGANIPDEEIRAGVSDRTFRITDDGNGTQVEYIAKDGRAYLWYPGNSYVLASLWKVEDKKLCFKYPTSSRDMNGNTGGKWECRSGGWWLKYRTIENVAGDPFSLSTSFSVPFKTQKYLIFFDISPPPTLAQLLEAKKTGKCQLDICAVKT